MEIHCVVISFPESLAWSEYEQSRPDSLSNGDIFIMQDVLINLVNPLHYTAYGPPVRRVMRRISNED